MAATTAAPRGPGSGPLLRRRVVTGLVVAPLPRPGDDVDPTPATDLTARVPGELVAARLVGHHDAALVGGRLVVRAPFAAAVRRWYRAAVAHRRVGALLSGLDPRWHVLHAVPLDDGLGVDHLVVGPGGVLVLRTAHHVGERVHVRDRQVRADGRPLGHVRDVERQVREVAARLGAAVTEEVPVRGVVVLVGARAVRAVDLPRPVTVLTDEDLVGWLSRRPRLVSQVVVDRLGRAAADPGTWGATPEPTEAVRREHGQACVEAVGAALGRWPGRRGTSPGLRRNRL